MGTKGRYGAIAVVIASIPLAAMVASGASNPVGASLRSARQADTAQSYNAYSLSCTQFSGSVKFSPPLKVSTTTFAETATVKGSFSGCTATPPSGGPAVTVASGKLSGTLALPNNGCEQLLNPAVGHLKAKGTLTAAWSASPLGSDDTSTLKATQADVPLPATQPGDTDYVVTTKKVTGAFSGQGVEGSTAVLEVIGTNTPEQLGLGCIASSGLKKLPLSGGLAELGAPPTSVAVSPNFQEVQCFANDAVATATATFPGGQQVDVTGASIWSATGDVNSDGAGIFECTSAPTTSTLTATFEGVAGSTSPWEMLLPIQISAIDPDGLGNPQDGTVGEPYSGGYQATGGTPPYTSWAIVEGSLPPGMSLDPSSGALTGTPTQAGDYSYTVQVTDSSTPNPLVQTLDSCIEIDSGS